MTYLELVIIGISLALLFFLSLVEGAISQSSPLSLRMMLERKDTPPPPLLSLVLDDEPQIMVPLHLGTQVSLITIAILTTHLGLQKWEAAGVAYSFGIIFLISILFRELLPRLLTQNTPENKLPWLLQAFSPLYPALRSVAFPLSSALRLSRRLHADAGTAEEASGEETSEEEIQAYLEIGEDEGILEKEDSELIQSVVEFGDTVVREVMTPRTRIVACEETATLRELRDIMVQNRHSRIPIFRTDMDHIIGIAYIRQLVAQLEPGKESAPITGLILPAFFVPETKPVSVLLRELQERGEHIAIVIDEFGGVSGLVTMEDLLEEIVGEIRDEDQANVSEIVTEKEGQHTVRGSTELYRFEELVGKRFEGVDCSTVAGLIVAYLGRVPAPGEEFDMDGLRIHILEADRKRIHRVRVSLPMLQDLQDQPDASTRGPDL
jgi:CBS domain containing-hemolysin-like protein